MDNPTTSDVEPFNLFSTVEANAVLKIPVSVSNSLVWHWSKNGIYVVKSGYRVALKLLGADSLGGPSSSFVPEEKFWKCFWKIKASPKLVNFLWIIFHNAMASRENLFSRKCASSPLWPFCNLEVESIEHILFGLWKCGINATFQRGAGFTLFG